MIDDSSSNKITPIREKGHLFFIAEIRTSSQNAGLRRGMRDV